MDRTSSRSHGLSHEVSSDERFDNAGGGHDNPETPIGIHNPAKKSPPSASTVAPLASTSSASSAFVLQPGEPDTDELTTPDQQTNMALASKHQFSEIPEAFITVYNKLHDVEANASSNHKRIRHQKRGNTEIADAIKFLKRQSNSGNSLEHTTHYQLLRGSRSDKSSMEVRLPAASAFRSKLYPPTGGVRDTRTGLYAELREVTINKKSVFVLCFPGTGAARNRDTQWNANLKQVFGVGGMPQVYQQALTLATELKTALADQGLTFAVAGHSMGGGIANFIGLALDIDSYCFNAAALGGACLNKLEIDGCLTPDRIARQNHVTLKGDYASNRTLSNAIGLLSPSGKRPQQVGKVYQATEEDEDFPQAIFALDRHPLDAMEDMMVAQKTSLWRNTRQSAATTPSSSSSSSTTTKSPASPAPTQSDPSTSDELVDDSESG